jgi:hypothetical protein
LAFLARGLGGKLGDLGKWISSFRWQDAFMFTPYATAVEQAMRLTYSSLNERQRRLYAAAAAVKLGHGGMTYLAHLFGCHRKTIQRGLEDLRDPASLAADQARKKGAAVVPV